MPALYALFQPDGAPVPDPSGTRMAAAMRHLGPPGGRAEAAGLALGALGPGFASDGEAALAADVRLDNRRELRGHLPDLPAGAGDAQLVLAAWRRWGEDAWARLEGNFSLILWDGAQRRLHCVADFLASRPLYYRHAGGGLAVATEPRALLAAGAPCRPNLRKFALLGTLLGAARDDESLFEGILAVRAGMALRFDASGLRLRRYWSAESLGRLRGPRTDAEWVDACRHALVEAVRCRLPSGEPPAILLSGGLDSSALAVTAAEVLGEAPRAVCSVSPDGEGDERRFVGLLGDRVRPVLVDCAGRGPFDDVGRVVWLDSSPLLTSRHYVYTALAEAAGGGVLLDGWLGEFGPSSHGEGCLAAALLRGQILRVGGELWRRGSWRELVRPFVPWRLLRRLGRGGETECLPLRPAFMREVLGPELDEAVRWTGEALHVGPDPRVRQRRLLGSFFGGQTGGFAGSERVERRFPFLDRRLLDVCMSAPPLLKLRRNLLRSMMAGRLPDGIRLRRDKGPFSPGYALHYEGGRERAGAFLRSIPAGHVARAALDLDAAARIAARPARGPADPEALHVLPGMVAAAVFLVNFDRFAQPPEDWEQP